MSSKSDLIAKPAQAAATSASSSTTSAARPFCLVIPIGVGNWPDPSEITEVNDNSKALYKNHFAWLCAVWRINQLVPGWDTTGKLTQPRAEAIFHTYNAEILRDGTGARRRQRGLKDARGLSTQICRARQQMLDVIDEHVRQTIENEEADLRLVDFFFG